MTYHAMCAIEAAENRRTWEIAIVGCEEFSPE